MTEDGIKCLTDKKLLKLNNLYNAAYDLFITKGIQNTAIDDIVKKAGVAKGTFYLYFKDKYDIIDRIILKKSSIIMNKAYEAMRQETANGLNDFVDQIVFFTDYIIEYFKINEKLLKLIYKNFSWGLFRRVRVDSDHYQEMVHIREWLFEGLKENRPDLETDEGKMFLFMIIELIGSVCYSSIILGEPEPIDTVKPYLLKLIRKVLSK